MTGFIRKLGRKNAGWGGRDRTCESRDQTRCLTTWLRPNAARSRTYRITCSMQRSLADVKTKASRSPLSGAGSIDRTTELRNLPPVPGGDV